MIVDKLSNLCLEVISQLTLRLYDVSRCNEDIQQFFIESWSYVTKLPESLKNETYDFLSCRLNEECYEVIGTNIVSNESCWKRCFRREKNVIFISKHDWETVFATLIMCQCPKLRLWYINTQYLNLINCHSFSNSTLKLIDNPNLDAYFDHKLTELDLELLKNVDPFGNIVKKCRSLQVLKLGQHKSSEVILRSASQCPLTEINVKECKWLNCTKFASIFLGHEGIKLNQIFKAKTKLIIDSEQNDSSLGIVLSSILETANSNIVPVWKSLKFLKMGVNHVKSETIAFGLLYMDSLDEFCLNDKLHTNSNGTKLLNALHLLKIISDRVDVKISTQIKHLKINSNKGDIIDAKLLKILPNLHSIEVLETRAFLQFFQAMKTCIEDDEENHPVDSLKLFNDSFNHLGSSIIVEKLPFFQHLTKLQLEDTFTYSMTDIMNIGTLCVSLETLAVCISRFIFDEYFDQSDIRSTIQCNSLKTLVLTTFGGSMNNYFVVPILEVFSNINNLVLKLSHPSVKSNWFNHITTTSNLKLKNFYMIISFVSRFPNYNHNISSFSRKLRGENPDMNLFISSNVMSLNERKTLIQNHWKLFDPNDLEFLKLSSVGEFRWFPPSNRI